MEANDDKEAVKEAIVRSGKKDLSALEMTLIPMFVADLEGKVVYGNEALAALVGVKKEHLAGTPVLSLIQSEISGIKDCLATGSADCIETWATIKGKRYFFEYRPIPTYDTKGIIRGVFETIIDRTDQKLVLQAVQELVARAEAGDLSARASIKAEGDYKLLVDGINKLLDALINPLNVAADYVDRISKGDIPAPITEEYRGDFNNIKNNLNNCIGEIHVLVDEVGVAIGLAREGDLSKRTNPDRSKGVYRKILRGINDVLDALINPLHVAADYVDKISKGDIPAPITEEYHGDFNKIKNNLNNLIGEIHVLVDEVGVAIGLARNGDLSKRTNSDRSKGVYRKILRGINDSLDALINPLNVAAEYVDRISEGDIPEPITEEYHGDFNNIKNNLNNLIGEIHVLVDEVGVAIVLARNGDLSKRTNSDRSKGVYRKILRGINDSLDALINPLNVAADYVDKISKGDIPAPITDSYNGDFNSIKNNLNKCIEAVNNLIADADTLAQAAVDGRLTIRAEAAKHKGDFRKIVEGVNNTLDAVIMPVSEASKCLQEMAKGNLDVKMRGDYKGDHAVIKKSLNATLNSLNEILNQVSLAVDQVTTGANQVSDSSQSLSQAATESASSLEEITASMHELTSRTNMNAENAVQANQLSAHARISAEKGEGEMSNMVRAMNEINEAAANISKIIKAIDEIAFQTNLLALNAAVEAARAGRHGKGFTVVAEEVRNLAQRSAAAAKETAEMIEGSIKKTEVGTKIAEETYKALEEIVRGATRVTDLIGEIAAASKEQAQGIGQINQGLSQVDQVTQQVTANAEESAAACEELSSQSLQVKQMLSRFKLQKQSFNLTDAITPESLTPEMIQMIMQLIQPQKMEAAAGSRFTAGKYARTRPAIDPSSIIALDDTEFGKF
jgi:methyl-accepting chemotaxis protein